MLSSFESYMASAVPMMMIMPPILYMYISRDVYIKYTKLYYFISRYNDNYELVQHMHWTTYTSRRRRDKFGDYY